MNDEIKVEVPKTVYVDVNLHLPKRLRKDLHDGEIICPHCHGTGIVKAQQIYGLKGLKNSAMFPFTHEYMIPCPNCYKGIVDTCKYCGQPSGAKNYTPEASCTCKGAIEAREKKQQENDLKNWEKAEKIDYAEALKRFVMVYIENWDRYIEMDCLLDEIYKESDRYDLRIYGTSESKIEMDAGRLIKDACADFCMRMRVRT